MRIYLSLEKKMFVYENIIGEVISFGGDTDTNACIVGGLIGLYFGLKNIPNKFIDKIKKCNVLIDKNKRNIYQGKQYFQLKLVEKLINITKISYKIVQ